MISDINYPTRESIKFAKRYFKSPVDTVVEVGVGNGANGINIFEFLDAKKLYLVDPFKPPVWWPDYSYTAKEANDNFNIVSHNTRDIESVILIRETSESASKIVPDELDLVYIDAIHEYEYVIQDIELWYKKVKIGGVLCGHDFYYDGVRKAVIEKFNFNMSTISENRKDWGAEGGDWWIVK